MSDVEALLREREGYLRRGLKNRVAAVDEALAALGVAVTSDDVETTDASPPKRRSSRARK